MDNLTALMRIIDSGDVKYYTLGELGKFYGGLSGKSKDDFVNGNAKFITYKNVYSNPELDLDVTDTVRINPGEKQRTLEYGDIIFTGSSETPEECGFSSVVTQKTDEKLYLNSFCFVFKFDDPSLMLPDFAKHLFRSYELRKQIVKTASGVTRYNVSKKLMEKVIIPIPTIETQRKIVEILDSFLDLVIKLNEELELRRKQYSYYIDLLYGGNYEGMVALKDKGAKIMKLSEVGTLTRGKRFVHADAVENGVPCIHYGELYTHYGIWANKTKSYVREELRPKLRYAKKNDVIIVGAGENNIDIGVGVAYLGDEPVAIHDACYFLEHNINPKYISYYLRTSMYHNQIKKYVSSGKICAISADGLGRALMPVPSLDEQDKIVKMLDQFDLLCNSTEIGLPAEIEARINQYEFYRNKLMTFKKMA